MIEDKLSIINLFFIVKYCLNKFCQLFLILCALVILILYNLKLTLMGVFMKRIAQNTVDQVKQYRGIVEYISQYVQLKKRGQNYVGCCPFHSEKTPSFTVSPTKGIFHCFGCHESGDLISFVKK